jgi:hypothetical protein
MARINTPEKPLKENKETDRQNLKISMMREKKKNHLYERIGDLSF